jgi:Tol biopolymer transport system component
MGMRSVLAVAVGAVALAMMVPFSRATFPGTNGSLAYDAKIGKHYQLFTNKADGSAPQQLTHVADGDALWAAWSPNGKQIAFERDVYEGVRVKRAVIYTMNADGSRPRSLTPTGLNVQPAWSPDGRLITFGNAQCVSRATWCVHNAGADRSPQAAILVMAANGSRVRRVVTMPLLADGFGASPTFSPDGKRIAFAWHKKAGAAIFTMSASGGGLKQVTPWQKDGLTDKIDWSPDGARIAFSSPGIGERPGISSNVFTVRTDGTGRVQLTFNRGGKVNNGLDSWSPDGKQIAFVSNRTGTYEIYVMNADGSGVSQLTRGPEAHRAAWGTHP